MIHNISRFIAALALLATAQGAWADTETVSYIDADGNEQTATATVLTGDVTADGLSTNDWGAILIPAGWYVVKNSKDGVDASYTAQLCYTGDNGTIHLILADGAEMTVSKSTNHAIYLDHGYPLAIYGQSGGTGRLTVTGKSKAIEAQGGITINGGIVNVTETGTSSNHHAIYVMNGITINGGQVTATTAGSGKGIYVYSAALTIGCRKASDFVSFNSYYGTVNIKSGQTLYNGATAYSGDNVDVPTGTVTLRPYSSDDFSVNDAGTEYTIKSAGGWNVFCDLLADNTMGYFSGKTVRLANDITVTRMAGGQPFTGTFDGDSHTLTLAYGTADAPVDAQFVAPFVEVADAAKFTDLTIAGSIHAAYTGSAEPGVGGLIGHLFGGVTIEGCTSTVEITSTRDRVGGFVGLCEHSVSFTDCVSSAVVHYSRAGNISGFVGWSRASEFTISFEGCLFNGKLLLDNGQWYGGGFVGWKGDGKTVNITNCLYAPPIAADEKYESGGATFCIQHDDKNPAVITNSYYTHTLGAAQGKQARAVTAGTDVTIEAIALTGTATQYTVSGITAYSGGGLQRGETLYYGIDDQLSLTLTTSAQCDQPGYQYAYTASAGTLSGQTLTMPDQDVTISVNTAALAPIDWATVNQGDSADDPYMIYNKDQLLLLAHRVNGTNGETAVNNGYYGKFFKLGADITFSHDAVEGDDYAENYEAIGGYYNSTYRYFKGNFDGANHTVSGIRIRKDGSGIDYIYQGLFGRIDSGASIYDVHLTDARIKGRQSVGGIVGYNVAGYIWRCSVTDSYITATGNANYGTICGRSDDTYRLRNNYYHGCTVNGTAVTSGMGCEGADITAYNGALPAYAITIGDGVSTTALASAPENGFVYNGVSYYREGLALPLACTEGYSATYYVGSTALDGTTYTVNATDCDVTINATLRSDGLQHEVSYMTADGTARTAKAIALDGQETVDGTGDINLAAGTYYVGTDIAYANRIYLNGAVTLILANGKTMTLASDVTGIEGNYNLTIYGQSLDAATAGTLSYDGTADGIYVINYVQHSGNVSITTTGSVVRGIDAHVTLRGGKLTISANGDNARAIDGYTHSILGGHLTANATGDGATGIYAYADDGTAITLGWTRPADRITASSISTRGGTVAVKDGQALTDGSGHIYTGTLTASELSGFAAETTLQPCLALADAADNTAAIADHAGQKLAVALSGRTLYKDGSWNTLCLPFAVSTLQGSPLDGATVMELDTDGYYDGNTRYTTPAEGRRQTGFDTATGTLYLYFKPAASILAGKPYIVKWDEGTDIESPVFSGVTIDNSSEAQARNTVTATNSGLNTVQFIGSHSPVLLTPADKSNLFLGLANTLYYPDAANNDDDDLYHVNSCRAYFHVDLSGAPNAVRAFVLGFGNAGDPARIIPAVTAGEGARAPHAWYTLDGRRLDKQPTAKGIYVNNGRKVVIK